MQKFQIKALRFLFCFIPLPLCCLNFILIEFIFIFFVVASFHKTKIEYEILIFCLVRYSVDGRERGFKLAERWSDDKVFSNRAYFMADKHPAELGVDHIRQSDEAIYRCRVDFKIAQTRNSKINLTIIGTYFTAL